ncbi:MAG TPA: ATP-binding protein [Gemmatimonadales bacterium]|nr:ATP-binding protein [Gemmatimonadales bacterium]
MTSPLQLCVRRTPASGVPALATQVNVRMPSDVACIEQTVSLVTHHCLAGTAATDRLRFRLQVAVAEALANAVMRGNQEEAGKSVLVEAELFPDRICVQITDEGIGFDPTQVPEPVRPEQIGETCGRGLFLIRKLVDEVHFNEQGNSICMTLRRR